MGKQYKVWITKHVFKIKNHELKQVDNNDEEKTYLLLPAITLCVATTKKRVWLSKTVLERYFVTYKNMPNVG